LFYPGWRSKGDGLGGFRWQSCPHGMAPPVAV